MTKLCLLCIPYQGHDSLPLCSQHASLRTHSDLVVLLHFPLHQLSRNEVQKIHMKKCLLCFIKLFLSNVLFFPLQQSETYMPNPSPQDCSPVRRTNERCYGFQIYSNNSHTTKFSLTLAKLFLSRQSASLF